MRFAKKRLDCFGKLERRKKRDKKYEHLATQQKNSHESVGMVMKMMQCFITGSEIQTHPRQAKVEESDMHEPKTHINMKHRS